MKQLARLYPRNMGIFDRIIRITAVVIIVVLYSTGQIGGALAIVLGIVAIAFLLSSIIGRCPMYVPFGISTRKRE